MTEQADQGGGVRHGRSLAARLGVAWPWIKLVIGVVLLVLLGWLVDWRRTIDMLLKSDPRLVVAAGAVLFFGMFISTVKWSRLVRVVCVPIDLWPLLRAYWIGTFFNNYLPSSVGGDVVRVLALGPLAPMAPVAASVLVERITGVAALAVLAAICLAVQAPAPLALGVALWLLVAAIGLALIAVWFGSERLLGAVAKRAANAPRLVARIVGKLARVAGDVATYRKSPGELALALGWSVLFYGTLVLFQFAVLRAVGSSISLADAAVVAPLVPLVSLLPVTANGLGLAEGAFVLFYTQMGVPADQAFAAALLRRLVSTAMSMPGGLLWLGSARIRRTDPALGDSA
ncbi:MAG: lysylphosphatidylglycerol synthase transmembrane domain-containing protein [Geminicoccaceae bacterium]